MVYHRSLVSSVNKLAYPLQQLLKESSYMVRRGEHSQAVQDLEGALVTATSLQIFDHDKPILVKAEASKHAVGAALEQDGVPVAFESRRTGNREKAMPAYNSELRATVHALTSWKQYIGNKPVTVETAHATLSTLLQKHMTTRLGYWLDKLSDSNLSVVCEPGKQSVVADAIARRPIFVGAISKTQETRTAGKSQFPRSD